MMSNMHDNIDMVAFLTYFYSMAGFVDVLASAFTEFSPRVEGGSITVPSLDG